MFLWNLAQHQADAGGSDVLQILTGSARINSGLLVGVTHAQFSEQINIVVILAQQISPKFSNRDVPMRITTPKMMKQALSPAWRTNYRVIFGQADLVVDI